MNSNLPRNEGVDESFRVRGLEGNEERPHVANERQAQVTRWEREPLFTQGSFIEPPVYIHQKPLQGHKNTKKASSAQNNHPN